MSINVDVKRKIVVDGKEYESLDQVPPEVRTAILKTLAQGPTSSKTTFLVNGKTYSSAEDLPAPLRAIVRGVAGLMAKPEADAVRPEPMFSARTIVIAVVVVAALFWLARLVL